MVHLRFRGLLKRFPHPALMVDKPIEQRMKPKSCPTAAYHTYQVPGWPGTDRQLATPSSFFVIACACTSAPRAVLRPCAGIDHASRPRRLHKFSAKQSRPPRTERKRPIQRATRRPGRHRAKRMAALIGVVTKERIPAVELEEAARRESMEVDPLNDLVEPSYGSSAIAMALA